MFPRRIGASMEVTQELLQDARLPVGYIRERICEYLTTELEKCNSVVLTETERRANMTTMFSAEVYVMSKQELKTFIQEIENKARLGIKVSEGDYHAQ